MKFNDQLEQLRQRDFAAQLDQLKKQSQNHGSPFFFQTYDLATDFPIAYDGNDQPTKTINQGGYELIFLREGSFPGARLQLEIDGSGQKFVISPGMRIRTAFKSLRFTRWPWSSPKGKIQLCIVKVPAAEASFHLPDDAPPFVEPVLLTGVVDGTNGTVNGADITAGQPGLALDDPDGGQNGIDVTGIRKVFGIMEVDDGANDLTSGILVPWFRLIHMGSLNGNFDIIAASEWCEAQGVNTIALPTVNGTNSVRRCFELPLSGMPCAIYFQIANFLPAPFANGEITLWAVA